MSRYYILFSIALLLFAQKLFASNELYINGQAGAISATAPTLFDSTGLIFVNGEIINNQGLFVNSGGTIELTGNWTNTPTAANFYKSTGTEKFYGTTQQTISGTMNGTTKSAAGFDNQFYNLKVYRNSTITTTPNKYITIGTNVNVANTLDFESSTPNSTYAGTGTNEAVIRTDASSPSNVGTYANEIYIRNPSTSAITNYATLSGNGQDRYIEGKLRRQVNAASTYDFPVGFVPTFKDGMEGFSLKFNSAPTSKSIIGYIEDQSKAVLYRDILCDVGKDPGPGDQQFPLCNGTPDGIFDRYYLDASNDLSHNWKATASDAVGTINYDITLYPGSVLDNASDTVTRYKYIPAACGATYSGKLLRVIAKDGIIGGTTQVGPGNWAPFRHLTAYIWCQFPAFGTQAISLPAQTSFSTFRIHGTNTFTSTALPVELTSFKLSPIDNEYFKLDWTTASELNNYGFEIQKSLDGASYSSIGFVRGNGTTNIQHDYTIDDRNVIVETNYYYKLKIIDTDGSFKYSNVLIGRLKANTQVSISNFYPNPTNGQSTLDVYSPKNDKLTATVYDVLGQIVMQEQRDILQGYNKLNYDFSKLAKSGYIIDFRTENQKLIRKIIKQ